MNRSQGDEGVKVGMGQSSVLRSMGAGGGLWRECRKGGEDGARCSQRHGQGPERPGVSGSRKDCLCAQRSGDL